MDITNNKYIKFIFDELGKVPGLRYSSMLYRKLNFDTAMSRLDKEKILTAIALLKMNGYLEEKDGGTPVMNLVLATEDKGNKVINYGKHVEIKVDLLDWIPYEEDRQNYGKLLYELTGDIDSIFPATDESVKEAIIEAGIQLPSAVSDRIDIYDFIMQHTVKSVYEKFLKSLSYKIESQGNKAMQIAIPQPAATSVTNVNISNPIVIGNMTDSKIKTIDKSQTTNVTVNGNDNQVVTNSKNTNIHKEKGPKSTPHWLQILYWIIGIALAAISIYKFIIV